MYCKAYYKRLSLSRHVKKCFARKIDENEAKTERPLIQSLVYSSCHKKYGEMLNKMSVKKEIFSKMQADFITAIALEDFLIIHYGEDLLKKSKHKRSLYHISNKLRECGKFLIQMRNLSSYSDMLSTLRAESFDDVIEATKKMARYDPTNRSFGAASLALHFGTTLKNLADLAMKLIFQKKISLPSQNIDRKLTDLKRFKKVIECQWTTELGSLALKDLNEKASTKPKLLPVTEDIIKLKKYLEKIAEEAYMQLKQLKKSKRAKDPYRILAEAVLILAMLHNRKRVGDIQYLELNAYMEQIHNAVNPSVQMELASSLTKNETFLTQYYKKIVSVGKGTRPVTILIPRNLQGYFETLFTWRKKSTWFSPKNTYFFTYPKSMRWINGCAILSKYAQMCGAKHPELLTSCRLRKHIATVTQVLSLKENEIDQLAKFMGHTRKTHETFYKYVYFINLYCK